MASRAETLNQNRADYQRSLETNKKKYEELRAKKKAEQVKKAVKAQEAELDRRIEKLSSSDSTAAKKQVQKLQVQKAGLQQQSYNLYADSRVPPEVTSGNLRIRNAQGQYKDLYVLDGTVMSSDSARSVLAGREAARLQVEKQRQAQAARQAEITQEAQLATAQAVYDRAQRMTQKPEFTVAPRPGYEFVEYPLYLPGGKQTTAFREIYKTDRPDLTVPKSYSRPGLTKQSMTPWQADAAFNSQLLPELPLYTQFAAVPVAGPALHFAIGAGKAAYNAPGKAYEFGATLGRMTWDKEFRETTLLSTALAGSAFIVAASNPRNIIKGTKDFLTTGDPYEKIGKFYFESTLITEAPGLAIKAYKLPGKFTQTRMLASKATRTATLKGMVVKPYKIRPSFAKPLPETFVLSAEQRAETRILQDAFGRNLKIQATPKQFNRLYRRLSTREPQSVDTLVKNLVRINRKVRKGSPGRPYQGIPRAPKQTFEIEDVLGKTFKVQATQKEANKVFRKVFKGSGLQEPQSVDALIKNIVKSNRKYRKASGKVPRIEYWQQEPKKPSAPKPAQSPKYKEIIGRDGTVQLQRVITKQKVPTQQIPTLKQKTVSRSKARTRSRSILQLEQKTVSRSKARTRSRSILQLEQKTVVIPAFAKKKIPILAVVPKSKSLQKISFSQSQRQVQVQKPVNKVLSVQASRQVQKFEQVQVQKPVQVLRFNTKQIQVQVPKSIQKQIQVQPQIFTQQYKRKQILIEIPKPRIPPLRLSYDNRGKKTKKAKKLWRSGRLWDIKPLQRIFGGR